MAWDGWIQGMVHAGRSMGTLLALWLWKNGSSWSSAALHLLRSGVMSLSGPRGLGLYSAPRLSWCEMHSSTSNSSQLLVMLISNVYCMLVSELMFHNTVFVTKYWGSLRLLRFRLWFWLYLTVISIRTSEDGGLLCSIKSRSLRKVSALASTHGPVQQSKSCYKQAGERMVL
jgi:hypothetical protein